LKSYFINCVQCKYIYANIIFQEYHKDARNNFKQEIAKLQEENGLQIKNKEDELKLLQDNITNLNQGLESLQLKYDKEVAEHQRLSNELTRINNESKVQISEKSSLERQVSYLIVENNFFQYNKQFILHFRYLSIKLNFIKVKQILKHYENWLLFKMNNLIALKKLF